MGKAANYIPDSIPANAQEQLKTRSLKSIIEEGVRASGAELTPLESEVIVIVALSAHLLHIQYADTIDVDLLRALKLRGFSDPVRLF